ncbi:potassium uptake protein [Mycoplasmopsis canis UFG4]|uniref:Potassium uptake protein n=2 Tax=Mycoplasmopsis canis TaxID=29555 RepID=I1A5N5_9BACT|nr:TrkA family potassium uptake protein [Mycoplasmopsis canis]AKF41009.1 potassium transporter KtrA [Mycoplasmopsis canis]AMD81125.1 potassium transporter KtrA [Mycoplasmopsis canis PG 14]EIE39809.1 potassium uptake protein [Mycoplasmopsis canis PG 14]EIE40025.1 potassium uptake protein [Mycoplasmopsis canis UF31]EIE40241.1 potassium uptake protein [Mycoplasmopsis canis UF33]
MKVRYTNDIAVIGSGRFGQSVVDQLLKLGKTITLIDKDEENLRSYKEDIENLIIGDAADIKLLKANKLDKIGTIVVAVPENIEIVAALLEIKAQNIIARATSIRHARVLRQIGVETIVSPEYETGKRTALIAANKSFVRYSENLQEIGDDFVIGTTVIQNKSLDNKVLKDIDFNKRGVTLVLIKSKGKSIRPNGLSKIHHNDIVTLIGEIADVNAAFEWLNQND